MSGDLLDHVQQLQFTDRRAAEALLVPFLREVFPALDIESVTLRPLAVSLNSFNGIAALRNGTRVFFKTHIERDGVIDEYYNADLLHEAGYNVLQPIHVSRTVGRQILVYPLVNCPSVFDAAWAIERDAMVNDPGLAAAQHASDDRLFALYAESLADQDAESAARAPIHQLFYHRLTGGRLDRFYGPGTSIAWRGESISMETVRSVRWTINGREYPDTLDTLIERAIRLLQPAQAGVSIIGHGDAHNGNVFYCADGLMYFDPAFAGRHDPLLDLVKPLYHNVFAMWMYHPIHFSKEISLWLTQDGDHWIVDHHYGLHPVRSMFLESKIERTLKPLVALLRARGLLRPDWKAYLKAALMCCPLLTMNLTDQARFRVNIALLGLTHAIEMGSSAEGALNRIDEALTKAD